jgi:hypothetical protein
MATAVASPPPMHSEALAMTMSGITVASVDVCADERVWYDRRFGSILSCDRMPPKGHGANHSFD